MDSINVVVARKRNIQVSANATAGILDSTTPVTLKTVPTITSGAGADRLDRLRDVNAIGETDGATLVYDEASDVYVVKKMNLADITGDLDGGNF